MRTEPRPCEPAAEQQCENAGEEVPAAGKRVGPSVLEADCEDRQADDQHQPTDDAPELQVDSDLKKLDDSGKKDDLVVTVTDEGGEPLEGAKVTVRGLRDATGTTGEDGVATFLNVGMGSHRVEVSYRMDDYDQPLFSALQVDSRAAEGFYTITMDVEAQATGATGALTGVLELRDGDAVHARVARQGHHVIAVAPQQQG